MNGEGKLEVNALNGERSEKKNEKKLNNLRSLAHKHMIQTYHVRFSIKDDINQTERDEA